MSAIVPKSHSGRKQKLLRQLRRNTEARTRVTCRVLINLLDGRSATQTAMVLGVARSTVWPGARGEVIRGWRRCLGGAWFRHKRQARKRIPHGGNYPDLGRVSNGSNGETSAGKGSRT
jgi:hypothetical protein